MFLNLIGCSQDYNYSLYSNSSKGSSSYSRPVSCFSESQQVTIYLLFFVASSIQIELSVTIEFYFFWLVISSDIEAPKFCKLQCLRVKKEFYKIMMLAMNNILCLLSLRSIVLCSFKISLSYGPLFPVDIM